MKVSDYIVSFLESMGVRDVFMLPGGGAMHLNDSIGQANQIKYTCCLHEQACVIAAEAYARVNDDIGVCVVTTGPAATNTITGVAAAWIESTPLFIISGQVKTEDLIGNQGVRQMGIQEVNIVPIVDPITKYSVMITDPAMIRYELEKCVFLAKDGRPGPVWLDIPLDLQAMIVDVDNLVRYEHSVKSGVSLGSDILDEVIACLNKAERPVILAGSGIRSSGGYAEFINLIEKLNIPVLTTWNSMDLLWEEHPCYYGRPGAIGQRGANFIIQNSDLLISIGTRLSLLQTGFNYKAFARNATKIMVDIDRNELKKRNVIPDIAICADAKEFIVELSILSDGLKMRDLTQWRQRCKELNLKYPVIRPEWKDQKDYANSYVLVDVISSLMKNDDIYVGGRAGTCIDIVIHAFKVKMGQRVLATKGLSSMGYGLPASIGTAIATGKKIVCINGDGGFLMNIQELETVYRLRLPVKIFVLDNSGYATIRSTQTNVFNKRFVGCNEDSGLSLGNIVNIAKAFNIKTFSIRNNEEIYQVVSAVLDYDGPVVCNVNVSPTQAIEPRQASYKTDNGQMASRPIDDMNPLLSREEYKSDLIGE